MSVVKVWQEKVRSGYQLTFDEAVSLYHQDLGALAPAANEIRQHFCGPVFDLCTIINAKSGRCGEDCKYCAQSAHYQTNCDEYPLLPTGDILASAQAMAQAGVLRFSLVTSGRHLSAQDVLAVCRIIETLSRTVPIKICGSFGLLTKPQYEMLRQAGLTRLHNNLETSPEYFPQMCTTHTFADKIEAVKLAQDSGLTVCSGGIFGLGESIEDRISLAFSLRTLGVTSVPINLLTPVKGTPYEHNPILSADELTRLVAVYRFILPTAFIRLAGGRGLLPDKGRSCFLAGANAAISGDMLTTSGITVQNDLTLIEKLGFKV